MKADISTRVVIRTAMRLVTLREKVRELVPFGPMTIEESDRDVARREMSQDAASLSDLAKRLGIKEK